MFHFIQDSGNKNFSYNYIFGNVNTYTYCWYCSWSYNVLCIQ